MTFNFTAPIDSEIAQLQAKLAELEAQKQLLASRESCANKILTDVEKCVLEMKEAGVDGQSLFTWAESIFSLITGDALPREKYNESQDENYFKTLKIEELAKEIEELKAKIQYYESRLDQVNGGWEDKYKELFATTNKQINQLTAERDDLLSKAQGTDELFEIDLLKIDLLKKVSDLTIERDTALEQFKAERRCNAQMKNEITELSNRCEKLEEELEKLKLGNSEPVDDLVVEGYKKTITSLTIANQELSEKLNKLRTELPQPQEETAPKIEQETEDPRQNPEFLEATKNQEIIAEFLKKLDRTTRVDRLIWRKIRELPFNPETMRELGLQINPKSKTHKYLLEQMPVMCAKYIEETGDSSDLDWLPEHFVEQVEYLLKMEASAYY